MSILIRFKNQSDYAFKTWMGSFPLSGHPLDEERFYVFVKSVARYRNKKWRSYQYFSDQLKASEHPFEEDDIDRYWNRMSDMLAFHATEPIPTVGIGDDGHGTVQHGVRNGQRYRVPISRAEYFDRRGASEETMQQAEYF